MSRSRWLLLLVGLGACLASGVLWLSDAFSELLMAALRPLATFALGNPYLGDYAAIPLNFICVLIIAILFGRVLGGRLAAWPVSVQEYTLGVVAGGLLVLTSMIATRQFDDWGSLAMALVMTLSVPVVTASTVRGRRLTSAST
jgi:hypothetical protein